VSRCSAASSCVVRRRACMQPGSGAVGQPRVCLHSPATQREATHLGAHEHAHAPGAPRGSSSRTAGAS
jgi:hypothetical protein